MTGMNKQSLREDILAFLAGRGISLHRLAQESGVDSKSLWLFVHKANSNLNTDSLFRLWPHLYGEQRPLPLVKGQPAPAEVSVISPAADAGENVPVQPDRESS